MARILYGVAGEGFGHSSRSMLIGRRLLDAGHEVLFAASQKALGYLSGYFPGRVRPVYGLHFIYQQGTIRPVQTVWSNLAGYPRGAGINRQLFDREVRRYAPDVVLSDFEPFSAWWAWRNQVPCITVDHEHMLTACRLESVPKHRIDRFWAVMITRGYHPWADAYVILNFFQTPLINSRAVPAPPVVREIVRQVCPWQGDYMTVYTTDVSPEIRRSLCDMLRRFPRRRFHIYGFDAEENEGNLYFKKTSTEGFIRDLAGCRAVVATAGFSLLSECLYFRKKMMLFPIRGQYEQIINAYYIQKAGWGRWAREWDSQEIEQFLQSLDHPSASDDSMILWPDNEGFFRILEQTFTRIGLNILLSGSTPSFAKQA